MVPKRKKILHCKKWYPIYNGTYQTLELKGLYFDPTNGSFHHPSDENLRRIFYSSTTGHIHEKHHTLWFHYIEPTRPYDHKMGETIAMYITLWWEVTNWTSDGRMLFVEVGQWTVLEGHYFLLRTGKSDGNSREFLGVKIIISNRTFKEVASYYYGRTFWKGENFPKKDKNRTG